MFLISNRYNHPYILNGTYYGGDANSYEIIFSQISQAKKIGEYDITGEANGGSCS